MNLTLEPLAGRFIALEPLDDRHREDLRAACAADDQIWKLYSYAMDPEHFGASWDRIMADRDSGAWLPWAVVRDGVCIGTTNLVHPEPLHRKVEIGGTYYAPAHRGGPVNPEAKRLLLAHAFAGGAERVYLKVDAMNARSRAAVLKLGAVQEGILRHDMVTWTARIRDSVYFSILADEWPAVRARLDARLAAFG